MILRQWDQAIQDFTKAIEINPQFFGAYNNLGIAYSGIKQFDQAIKVYTKSIEINPQNANAYHNRANAYSKLNEYKPKS